MFYASVKSTGPDTVTMSAGGGGMLLFEVSGIGAQDGSSVIGIGTSNAGFTPTLDYTTGDFIVGAARVVCTSPIVTAGPGFTYVSQSAAEWVGAQYITSAGPGHGNFQFSTSSVSQWDEIGVAFLSASSSGSSVSMSSTINLPTLNSITSSSSTTGYFTVGTSIKMVVPTSSSSSTVSTPTSSTTTGAISRLTESQPIVLLLLGYAFVVGVLIIGRVYKEGKGIADSRQK